MSFTPPHTRIGAAKTDAVGLLVNTSPAIQRGTIYQLRERGYAEVVTQIRMALGIWSFVQRCIKYNVLKAEPVDQRLMCSMCNLGSFLVPAVTKPEGSVSHRLSSNNKLSPPTPQRTHYHISPSRKMFLGMDCTICGGILNCFPCLEKNACLVGFQKARTPSYFSSIHLVVLGGGVRKPNHSPYHIP